jgi:DNA invertase Pin-like site-specific DNA recombinase
VKFVIYARVSTQRQGESGLGLDAQRAAVKAFADAHRAAIVDEFVEIETGKGADALAKRPQLKAALDLCKKTGAKLVIAKLDRLARNVHFISGLIESGVDFIAADMPQANKVMIQMFAVMGEWERDQISARTKNALAEAKARNVKLGTAGPKNLNIAEKVAAADEFALTLQPTLDDFNARGLSQRQQVAELNSCGIKTAKGGEWSLIQLQRVLARLAVAA